MGVEETAGRDSPGSSAVTAGSGTRTTDGRGQDRKSVPH